MKKVIFTLFTLCLLYVNSNGQACTGGSASGPGVCTPTPLDSPGLSPKPADLAPVINGGSCPTIIHFKNYNTFSFGGQNITIQNLGIDSIVNLPAGLCWATNKTNNTFANQENGCIKVSGTCCSAPGQYALGIFVAADIGGGTVLHTNASAVGLYYYVRVNNLADSAARAIDTTGQAAGTNRFKSYSNEAAICNVTVTCVSGIEEPTTNIGSMNVVPNPFNNKAVVSFFADKETSMTEKLTNMLGSVVYTREMQVKMGENSSVIEKNNLPSGIYFYTLSNGKSLVTKRVVIE